MTFMKVTQAGQISRAESETWINTGYITRLRRLNPSVSPGEGQTAICFVGGLGGGENVSPKPDCITVREPLETILEQLEQRRE